LSFDLLCPRLDKNTRLVGQSNFHEQRNARYKIKHLVNYIYLN